MTLIEVVLALGLLGLFMAAAITLVTQFGQHIDAVRERAQATALAWNRIQRAQHLPFSDIDDLAEPPPGTRINQEGQPDESGGFQRQTFVEVMTNRLVMKNIRVEVRSLDRRTRAFALSPETVETLITDIPVVSAQP